MAALALRGLARKRLALPLLHHLLALLDDLLMLFGARLLDPLSSRTAARSTAGARSGCKGACKGRGDMRRRPLCHGRTLRCSRAQRWNSGPWCCDVRGRQDAGGGAGDVRPFGRGAMGRSLHRRVDGTAGAGRDAPFAGGAGGTRHRWWCRGGGPSPVARPPDGPTSSVSLGSPGADALPLVAITETTNQKGHKGKRHAET